MTADIFSNIYAFFSSDEIRTQIIEAWTVPAGLIFLYFYGMSHFNTPTYSLELSVADGSSVRLITPTPPKFTTTRSKYNRYALFYTGILEIAFICLIFLYPTIMDAVKLAGLTVPNISGPLEHRTLMALFLLTGVLSSFPIVSKIDSWLLEKLHKGAFIPDESSYLAGKLYESDFIPRADVFSEVRDSFSMRDTSRVANNQAKGELEKRSIDLFCLRTQVHSSMETDRYKLVKIKLEKDFAAIANQTQGLRANIVAYLRWQARLLPDDVDDIDQYIAAHDDDPTISELAKRRQELKTRCDIIFETMCLVIGLTICATNVKQDDVDDAVKSLGFRTHIEPLPTFDLETVVSVTGLSFILWILFSGAYNLFGRMTGAYSMAPELFPTRTQVLRFSFLLTIAFAVIMTLSIKLKRHWRAERQRIRRSEDVIVGIVSYFATVPLNMGISYIFNGNVTNPLPYLFAINQGILGYYFEIYRFILCKTGVRFDMAILQGLCQGLVAGIAASFAENSAVITVGFSAIQWGTAGVFVGILFQYIYGKAVVSDRIGSDVVQRTQNVASMQNVAAIRREAV